MRLEQQIGQQRRRAQRFGQLDQDAEREAVVDHRLADVEHAHAVAREDRGQRVRDAGAIVTGDADQQRAGLPRAHSGMAFDRKVAIAPVTCGDTVASGPSDAYSATSPVFAGTSR